MAWENLPTDYMDAVWAGLRKYTEVTNSDGTVSFQDVTQYTNKEKSFYGAKEANRVNEAINTIMNMVNNGTDLYQSFQTYFTTQKELFDGKAKENQKAIEDYVAKIKADGDQAIATVKTNYDQDITKYKNDQQEKFNIWFEGVRDKLNESTAGKLTNDTESLKTRVTTLENKKISDYPESTTCADDGKLLYEDTTGLKNVKVLTLTGGVSKTLNEEIKPQLQVLDQKIDSDFNTLSKKDTEISDSVKSVNDKIVSLKSYTEGMITQHNVQFADMQTDIQNKYKSLNTSINKKEGSINASISGNASKIGDLKDRVMFKTRSKLLEEIYNFDNTQYWYQLRNSICAQNSLGFTFTSSQRSAIRNGTFDGMFVGSSWFIEEAWWVIVGFNIFKDILQNSCYDHIVLMPRNCVGRTVFETGSDSLQSYGIDNSTVLSSACSYVNNKLSSFFGDCLIKMNIPLISNNNQVAMGQKVAMIPTLANITGANPIYTTDDIEFYERNANIMTVKFPIIDFDPSFRCSAKAYEPYWTFSRFNNNQMYVVSASGGTYRNNIKTESGIRPYVVVGYPRS